MYVIYHATTALRGGIAKCTICTGSLCWSVLNGKLHKDYEFADFDAAFGFMKKASFEIEKMNHHPEWFNVYNKVTVDLVTHDAGGITENDTKLAGILNELAGM